MPTLPYCEGYQAGVLDRYIEYRSEYCWYVENFPDYAREYSRGYTAGWTAKDGGE